MRWTHGGARSRQTALRRLTIACSCRPRIRAVSAPTTATPRRCGRTPLRYPVSAKTIGFPPSAPAGRGGGPYARLGCVRHHHRPGDAVGGEVVRAGAPSRRRPGCHRRSPSPARARKRLPARPAGGGPPGVPQSSCDRDPPGLQAQLNGSGPCSPPYATRRSGSRP